MTRRRLLLAALVAVLASLPTAAQVREQSGAALDANLQLGSGGYNRAGRGAVGQRNTVRLYTPMYAVSRPQDIRADRYDSFLVERRYGLDRPIGYYAEAARRRAAPAGSGFSWGARRVEPEPGARPAAPLLEPAPPSAPTSPDTTRQEQEISYGIGFYLGREIREGLALDGVQVDAQDVVAGFGEGLRDLDPSVPVSEFEAALGQVHARLQARMVERLLSDDPQFRRRSEENLAHGRAFRDEFGQKSGVVTLPDGIQYTVLAPGTGASPGPTGTVVLNVRITHVDGTEISRAEGLEVRVDRMVEAGAEVLPRMKAGARWVVAIPPDLAYGAAGLPPAIGPNETLLVEVELVRVGERRD
jgi:FKBP-type peptidyl-prolyl cis-trans isomerase